METVLYRHLVVLSEAYAAARGIGDATTGRLCAADGRFFARLREGKTFTVRKYDEVIAWFSDNWPETVDWPPEVERPPKAKKLEAAE